MSRSYQCHHLLLISYYNHILYTHIHLYSHIHWDPHASVTYLLASLPPQYPTATPNHNHPTMPLQLEVIQISIFWHLFVPGKLNGAMEGFIIKHKYTLKMINVTNVSVRNPICPFKDPFLLEITFECLRHLPEELTWKLIYIGSAKDQSCDQVLEEVAMGPLSPGTMQFTFEASAPDETRIPPDELMRITAIILEGEYLGQEFFRLGYYVYNQFFVLGEDVDSLMDPINVQKVQRSVLSDKPRITRVDINWERERESLERKSEQGTLETLEASESPMLSI